METVTMMIAIRTALGWSMVLEMSGRWPCKKALEEGGCPMSALGQKQTFGAALPMSALPPKADILRGDVNVR